ncbi:MAG: hypothetical protein E4H10_16990 [Bacteroidia bacterium]|nr:MAG: hypothetical protein E4H10_16990 [Bacteroidia bacterium]
MKRSLIAGIVLLLGMALQAQDMGTKDILSLSFRYGLPGEYKEVYTGEATEIGMLNSLTAGFKLAPRTMFAINVNHFYFNVKDGVDMPQGIASPIILNGIILRTGIVQQVGDAGKLQLLIAPRLMSDFKNMDGNSFQLGAVVSYEKASSRDFSWGVGGMYNQELYGPYFVPLFLINWQVSERWFIEGMLPVTAKVHFRATEGLDVGFNHFGLTTSYALGHEDYAGDYIERFSVDLSLFARQRLFGNFYVEGMVGRTFGRGYKQYAGDQKIDFGIPLINFGDDRVAKNVTFKDGMIFTLKLIFNMNVPE